MVWVHATRQWPTGTLFYCPRCGEAWGRAAVEDQDTYAIARRCKRCPPLGFDPPGSMWLDWDAEHNAAMPAEALTRELQLQLGDWA
jgi:hypothetical protein